ncbi:bifunctional DNA primase/polymerase [Beutenbergia cavernae]|uniref:bifunctional DNA primase/polymerase n=1 Tax=Beutenbergia cavernae TaxID=84757 RepID=UPI00019AD22D|nr:bifunctional DNA primase/polymerase [Beutenbergia cavernae]
MSDRPLNEVRSSILPDDTDNAKALATVPADVERAWSRYLDRGWHPVALYGVADGACTCRDGGACADGGKHPVLSLGGSSYADVDPLTYVEAIERAVGRTTVLNVGLATGRASGFWVLDIDPAKGGAASIKALEAEHGALAPTRRVRTGSGGWHLYYAMPLDGSDVRNSQGLVAPGIDVRGTGGYVVAPPSVSTKGAYSDA